MSSLTYHAEHLGWQQRVNQEKSRASNFYRTVEGFPTVSVGGSMERPIFPKASVDENPINYRALRHNLAYTFGGSKPIKYSWKKMEEGGKALSKSPEKLRNKVREASIRPIEQLEKELMESRKKCGGGESLEGNLAYIKKLEEKLIMERKKRIKAEQKLQR